MRGNIAPNVTMSGPQAVKSNVISGGRIPAAVKVLNYYGISTIMDGGRAGTGKRDLENSMEDMER